MDWLQHGAEFPYDAPDKWWRDDGDLPPPPADDWAHAAARGVLANLSDRRGIKQELNSVDEDVRVQLVADLAAIIRAARPTPDSEAGS